MPARRLPSLFMATLFERDRRAAQAVDEAARGAVDEARSRARLYEHSSFAENLTGTGKAPPK